MNWGGGFEKEEGGGGVDGGRGNEGGDGVVASATSPASHDLSHDFVDTLVFIVSRPHHHHHSLSLWAIALHGIYESFFSKFKSRHRHRLQQLLVSLYSVIYWENWN